MCHIFDSLNFNQTTAIVQNFEIGFIVGKVKREPDLIQRTDEYNRVLFEWLILFWFLFSGCCVAGEMKIRFLQDRLIGITTVY
jgi:hypothetical protein